MQSLEYTPIEVLVRYKTNGLGFNNHKDFSRIPSYMPPFFSRALSIKIRTMSQDHYQSKRSFSEPVCKIKDCSSEKTSYSVGDQGLVAFCPDTEVKRPRLLMHHEGVESVVYHRALSLIDWQPNDFGVILGGH